ncbi:MAG: YbhB/YbcL family Raf kinase inhibitor-like protein [Rhabdochlamydiaceae bacterium]
MQLTSPAFKQGESIPSLYTCQGKDINPPLIISNVPKNAKALVLIMDDPDVPLSLRKDGMWVHWVIFNIPPETRNIEENTNSMGILGKGTRGDNRYQGPCPPDREHRYFFKLYALDSLLNLKVGATKEEVEQEMEGHVLAYSELMGKYQKK